MYRPFVVWLNVYDGVESKALWIRGGLWVVWVAYLSYVCNVITFIHRMCVVCYGALYCCTVRYDGLRVDGKPLVLSVTVRL